MSDAKDKNPDQKRLEDDPYLLDDDELLAAVEREFEQAEQQQALPDDELRLQRNWQALQKASHAPKRSGFGSWWLPLAAAVLLALSWPLLRRPATEPSRHKSNFKSGPSHEAEQSSVDFSWQLVDATTLELRLGDPQFSGESTFLAILATGWQKAEAQATMPRQAAVASVLWSGRWRDWAEPLRVDLLAAKLPADGVYRVCLLTAPTAELLQRKVEISLPDLSLLADEMCR